MREPPFVSTVLAPLLALLAACGGTAADHAAADDTGSVSPAAAGDAEKAASAGGSSADASVPAQDADAGSGSSVTGDAVTDGGLPSLGSFLGGTNLSALEFNSGTKPGRPYYDYGVPTHAEVDYFVGKKMLFIRLPFLWERLQPVLDGDFDATYLGFVTDLTDYATSKGATVLLDPHNYARYNGLVIGSTSAGAATAAQFGAFWGKLAALFARNPKVIFGLMNEPNGMATELWLADANTAIASIRAVGATNVITVPGNGYTGAHSWTSDGYGTADSTVMLGVKDPLDNYVYEVHQYLDADSSGTHSTCDAAPEGSQSLMAFTEWARANGKRAMIGELGAADNATCLSNLDDFLSYVDRNRDVFAGWTYWSAGPWWGTYMYSIEPGSTGADAPQMATLLKHL
jgi:endoglucanase